MLTKTQRKTFENTLQKIKQCKKSCKDCEHCKSHPLSTSQAVGYYTCSRVEEVGLRPFSNTAQDLKKLVLKVLRIKLS